MSTQSFGKEILKHDRDQLSEVIFVLDQTDKASVVDMYAVLSPVMQGPQAPATNPDMHQVSAEVITQAQQASDFEARRLAQIRDDIYDIHYTQREAA